VPELLAIDHADLLAGPVDHDDIAPPRELALDQPGVDRRSRHRGDKLPIRRLQLHLDAVGVRRRQPGDRLQHVPRHQRLAAVGVLPVLADDDRHPPTIGRHEIRPAVLAADREQHRTEGVPRRLGVRRVVRRGDRPNELVAWKPYKRFDALRGPGREFGRLLHRKPPDAASDAHDAYGAFDGQRDLRPIRSLQDRLQPGVREEKRLAVVVDLGRYLDLQVGRGDRAVSE